ncbi:MAG: hypothetical protein U9O98_02245 [Asgard group archaeon]|nr:hypothetical protein [Asgard group archaeon]
MTFDSEAKKLQKKGVVGALALIDANGKVVWKTNNWDVDGQNVIQTWQEKKPSINVQGIKYSTIDVNNQRFIGTNVKRQGHIVIAKTPFWAGFVMSWCPPDNPVRLIYPDIARLAAEVKP